MNLSPTEISLMALAISFVSILLTFISLRNQRIHYRKSVKPIAVILLGDYEDYVFVKIINSGLGPLIIDELEVKNGNVKSNNLIEIVSVEPPVFTEWSDYVIESEGRALGVKEELILLEIGIEEDFSDKEFKEYDKFISEVRKFLSKSTIKVSYKDLYGKSYTETRNLTLFSEE